MVLFLTKTQLPALLPAWRIGASSVKKKRFEKKARKDGSNRVGICNFFAVKERVMLNKATHSERKKRSH